MTKILIANRGEIAVRIARAAAERGIPTVAVHPEDDAASLHVRVADEARALPGQGVAAYLDIDAVIEAARAAGADAIHPGYGFLAENASFARRCAEAGLTFIGPTPEQLELFGDKVRARALAEECGVPVMPGTMASDGTELDEAEAFFRSLDGAAAIVKAVAGGGGRGMRVVRSLDELEESIERASAEARAAFGDGSVYLERLVEAPRHIEVQIVGDGVGGVVHLWERDCSIQRRHQKLVEVAPSPGLPSSLRDRITDAAVTMAKSASYRGLGTFEFLVESRDLGDSSMFAFIEANPRIQVEHTVTEEVTGLDLVDIQVRIASGQTLTDLGLTQDAVPAPRGFAIQSRVNMETMAADGSPRPAGGTLAAFEPPTGPGVRTDTFGYAGYTTSPRYDSLLAKVIAHSAGDFRSAAARAYRALAEFRIEGVQTNLPFLQGILAHPDFLAAQYSTNFIEEHRDELLGALESHRRLQFAAPSGDTAATEAGLRRAGAQVDKTDVLAVLTHGAGGPAAVRPSTADAPSEAAATEGAVRSALQGTIVSIEVAPGDEVRAGQLVVVMEAMKMQHEVRATVSGTVERVTVEVGDAIYEGEPLVFIEPGEIAGDAGAEEEQIDLDYIRPDLAEVERRRSYTYDDAPDRQEAVEKRHARGLRTARENIEDLCDPGTFV
ncbi:MAG: ATP-grasp domain-containing protein, partial [Dehalococcoidia bacterium]|nr:ATP-grasp domain-containing protein [Dehalococcoidia bacterium]